MRQRRERSPPTIDDSNFADDGSLQYDILKSRKRFQQKVALLQQSLARRREERSVSGISSSSRAAEVKSGQQQVPLTALRPSTSPSPQSASTEAAEPRGRRLDSRPTFQSAPHIQQQLSYKLSPSPVPAGVVLPSQERAASYSTRSASMQSTALFSEHSPPPIAYVNPRALVDDDDEADLLETNCFTDARRRSAPSRSTSEHPFTPFYPHYEREEEHKQPVASPRELIARSSTAPLASPEARILPSSAPARHASRSPPPAQVPCFMPPPPMPRSPVRRPFVKEMIDFPVTYTPPPPTAPALIPQALRANPPRRSHSHTVSPSWDRDTVRGNSAQPQRGTEPHQDGLQSARIREQVFCLRPPVMTDARLDSIRRQREERDAKAQKREAATVLRMESRRREAEARHQQRLHAQRQALKKPQQRASNTDRGLVAVRSRSVSAHSLLSSRDSVPRSVSPQTLRPLDAVDASSMLLDDVPRGGMNMNAHQLHAPPAKSASRERSSSTTADRLANMYRAQSSTLEQQREIKMQRDGDGLMCVVDIAQRQAAGRAPPPPRRSASADTTKVQPSRQLSGVRLTAPRLDIVVPLATDDAAQLQITTRCHSQHLAPSESPTRPEWPRNEAASSCTPDRPCDQKLQHSGASSRRLLSAQRPSPTAADAVYLSPESLRAHNDILQGRRARRSNSRENDTVDVQADSTTRPLDWPTSSAPPHTPQYLPARDANLQSGRSYEWPSRTNPSESAAQKRRFTLRSLYGSPSNDASLSVVSPFAQPRVQMAWPPVTVATLQSQAPVGHTASQFGPNDDIDADDMLKRIADMRRMMASH